MSLKLRSLTGFWFMTASARAMAGTRIILGLALLYDALSYLPERHAMFGEGGVFGPAGSERSFPTLLKFFGISGDVFALSPIGLDFVYALFICGILLFTLGSLYRVSAFTVWIILNYFTLRNYLVFDSGHNLAANLMFFMIFVPADRVASVGAYLKTRSFKNLWQEQLIKNAWAVRAMQFQMSILYFSTFIYKLDGPNWRAGTAVYYATRLPPYFRTQFEFLVSSGILINLATYGTLIIEGVLAVLIWIPRLRYWLLALAICFHLALEATMVINIFQWVMVAGLLSFIEGRKTKSSSCVNSGQ
ncbi:hypothetical protein AZI86_16210 [Bdellovibrio bacteriovorus]|uniref:HTTM-like domain-containing protein n=1 Tax=Bdellovibrio bacteriovorus TaxID=959 RepID=A0A150WHC6_BDEBC|nr:HTTM domain-containing protein [Bdellovibrio bacteriovorus]KYG62380.1 hypothetical protein AZI86_16210 [Bdellovibrio bacteriovorus]